MAISRNRMVNGIVPDVFDLFDVTADWTANGVTDAETFKDYLEGKGYSAITVENFTLVGQRIVCNLQVLSIPGNTFNLNNIDMTMFNSFGYVPDAYNLELQFNSLTDFAPAYPLPPYLKRLWLDANQIASFTPDPSFIEDLIGIQFNTNQITDINPIIPLLPDTLLYLGVPENLLTTFDPTVPLPSSLTQLDLSGNEIVSFDPTLPLPDSLTYITLNNNNLTAFDPTLPLPASLQNLELDGNDIDFDPSLPLPSGLTILTLNSCGITLFNPSIALPSTLEKLELGDNEITFFGPTIPLPTSLDFLRLDSNQMTTADYTSNEPWATSLHNAPGFGGTINFVFNPDSPGGTTMESILLGKGWNVIY